MPIIFANHAFEENGVPIREEVVLRALENLRIKFKSSLRTLEGDALARELRVLIKDAYITQYVVGHGGRSNMTKADWGRIGGLVGRQYRYLRAFVTDMPNLTQPQILARADLYLNGSIQSYYRARAAEWHISLPDYPGSGNTSCKSNCGCSWSIVQVADHIEATWRLNPMLENCPDCFDRSQTWAPLVVAGG